MGHALDVEIAQQGTDGFDINHGWRQKRIAHAGPVRAGKSVVRLKAAFSKDFARQGIAVGMQTRRGDADDLVAHLNARTVNQPGVVHEAHAKARQIIFAGRVHIGHFGGFAAQQSATGLTATFRNAADHGLRRIHIKVCLWQNNPGKRAESPLAPEYR